ASASDGTVKVWDVTTGQDRLTLKGCNAVFSPDGKRLASTSGIGTIFALGSRPLESEFGGAVKLWDAGTGRELLTLQGDSGGQLGVAFSPDGMRLASSGFQTVTIWDPATGQIIRTWKGHAEVVHGLAFSPDGKRLASAGWDNTVKVWDVATGQEIF